MLCYCIQIEFTSLVRIKTLCLLYLLSVVEAGCCFLVSFSRVSSVLCFGCHVVGSCSFGEPLLRDVTGKALLCSRCSVVLRHWHGPRLHKWLVFKVRVQRTGARWSAQLRGVSEMFKPCSRESERQKRRESAPLAMNYYHEMNVSLGNLLVATSLCSVTERNRTLLRWCEGGGVLERRWFFRWRVEPVEFLPIYVTAGQPFSALMIIITRSYSIILEWLLKDQVIQRPGILAAESSALLSRE